MTLTDQIISELDRAVSPWGPLVGLDIVEVMSARIRERAPLLASQLTSGDDHLVAETVTDLMCVLPDPLPDWWATPLGQTVARSSGSPLTETVSYTVAAAMLGVSRTRVAQLVTAGRIEAGDGGSIRTVSLLDEALRRGQ